MQAAGFQSGSLARFRLCSTSTSLPILNVKALYSMSSNKHKLGGHSLLPNLNNKADGQWQNESSDLEVQLIDRVVR